MYHDFVVIPTTNKLDKVHSNAFNSAYGKMVERYMTIAATATLLLGIILGFPLHAWSNLGHLYGNTYLVAFILSMLIWMYGFLTLGRNVKKWMALNLAALNSLHWSTA